jgi:hypothetical protein
MAVSDFHSQTRRVARQLIPIAFLAFPRKFIRNKSADANSAVPARFVTAMMLRYSSNFFEGGGAFTGAGFLVGRLLMG